MSPTLYNLLWVIYLVAGALLMWMVWVFTKWQRLQWLAGILRVSVFVLVFTPAKLYHEPDYLVPALVSLAFDKILGHEEAVFASSVNLTVSAIVCTFVFIMYYVVLRILHSRKAK